MCSSTGHVNLDNYIFTVQHLAHLRATKWQKGDSTQSAEDFLPNDCRARMNIVSVLSSSRIPRRVGIDFSS
ncbi:hypothetical protein EW146_g3675 [Bondarzewia mesenterica]|uniref:Uncharacterized protein n=1 Tax=Bondarzewia mesenterica TaxID=1095465 RepID=A0A4S4LWU1_9AGAM|nr:hypothetical protein EW146_g3675 [Bondarzewia mesenterica]